MVTIAEILNNVVDSLPPVVIGEKSCTVRFFDGVKDDIQEQINTYKKVNSLPYPCVWLLRDISQNEELNRVNFTNLTLYFLIDTLNDYQTPERLNNRINPYLIPLADDIIKGLRLSGVYVENINKYKITFLNSANAGASSGNPQTNSRLFADYLDGLKLTINASYSINLKTVCYEFR